MIFYDRSLYVFCIATCVSATFSLLSYLLSDNSFTSINDPNYELYRVTVSLWEEYTFESSYLHEVQSLVTQESITHPKTGFWQDTYSITQAETLFPKHSPVSALIAAPFYGLAGIPGMWLMQQLLFGATIMYGYRIARTFSERVSPLRLLIGFCCGGPMLYYSRYFSYDLHSLFFIACGAYYLLNAPIRGSCIINLAIYCRPSSILFTLPLTVSYVFFWKERRFILYALSATSLCLTVFLLTNQYLWGSLVGTSYSRAPQYLAGEAFFSTHPYGFSLNTLIERWGEKLFSPTIGLLTTAPLLLLLPSVLYTLRHHPYRVFLWSITISSLSYCGYLFSYEMWDVTTTGNRFLLGPIFIISSVIFSAEILNEKSSSAKEK